MEDRKAIELLERILHTYLKDLTRLIQEPILKDLKEWAVLEIDTTKELHCWLNSLKRFLF